MQNINKLFLLFTLSLYAPQDPKGEEGEAYKIIDMTDDPDEDDRDNSPRTSLPKDSVIIMMDDVSYLKHSQSCQPIDECDRPQWYEGRSVAGEDQAYRNAVTNSQP